MKKPRAAYWLRGYSLREWPAWGKVMFRAGLFDDARWRDAPTRRITGKLHGYEMELQLSNWSERQTYFLGRFYDLETQLALGVLLRPGDRFLDIGANIGMITLYAARRVGAAGRVYAFEPNPDAFARLRAAVEGNGLQRAVSLYPVGLADAAADLTLSVLTEHTGLGTLAPVAAGEGAMVSKRHQVRVERGDDVLAALDRLDGIKIDVEGFECSALHGLRGTLSRHRPWVVSEVVDAHLRRAGASAAELVRLFESDGYEGHVISCRRRGLRQALRLLPVTSAQLPPDCNMLFVRRDAPVFASVAPFIAASH